MDDANQAQPIQQTQSTNQNFVTPSQPVNIAPKEQEPINSSEQATKGEELISPSEIEPQISKEVAEVGIEKVQMQPGLSVEAKEAGIQHAKEATLVSTQPSGIVQLMQNVKAQGGNTKSSSNSIRWLWELLKKLMKLGH